MEWKKARKKPIVIEFREVDTNDEGILKAYPKDDYIIRGVEGEIYPIKKEIFHKTYDVVEDE